MCGKVSPKPFFHKRIAPDSSVPYCKHMNNKSPKTKPYYVPRSIQSLFVIFGSLIYIIQLLVTGISTFIQFQDGSDYRPQLSYFAIYNLFPVLLFAIAYFLNPRKLSRLSKIFESLLITISAYTGWVVFVSLFLTILLTYISPTFGYNYVDLLASLVFLSIYAPTLLIIRRKGIWK